MANRQERCSVTKGIHLGVLHWTEVCCASVSELLTLRNPVHLPPESDTSYYLKYKKKAKWNLRKQNTFRSNKNFPSSYKKTLHSRSRF